MSTAGLSPEEIARTDLARVRLRRFVEAHGVLMHPGEAPMTGDPGECWTNAWRGEGAYVEGIVFDAAGAYGGTHAWNLSPLGTVIERTPDYGHAARYVGVVIDRRSALAAGTLRWKGWRSSTLEAALEAASPARVLDLLHRPMPGNRAARRSKR